LDGEEELKPPRIECSRQGSHSEAVQQCGWQEVGEDVDGYVGLCPACAKHEAGDPAKVADTPAAVASQGGHASENPVTAEPPRPPQSAVKPRTKQQPLYMRMFMDKHMTALVRAVGHAGFPASEGPERMKPLVEEFGEPLMRAAADEVVEIDHTRDPPLARLTSHARKLAVGLLGRPPEAPLHVPLESPAPAPSAQADSSPASKKPARKRKKKSNISRSRSGPQSNDATNS
jgi:hypothetical protein